MGTPNRLMCHKIPRKIDRGRSLLGTRSYSVPSSIEPPSLQREEKSKKRPLARSYFIARHEGHRNFYNLSPVYIRLTYADGCLEVTWEGENRGKRQYKSRQPRNFKKEPQFTHKKARLPSFIEEIPLVYPPDERISPEDSHS